MWYFSWILGLGLALTLGVLNAIWYEMMETHETWVGEHGEGAPESSRAPSSGGNPAVTTPLKHAV